MAFIRYSKSISTRGKLKYMSSHGAVGIEPTTFGMLAYNRSISTLSIDSNRADSVHPGPASIS